MESGSMAESYFGAKIESKAWHLYHPSVDTGVDCIVETPRGGMKKVQITIGSPHKDTEGAFVINKRIDKIREDVDVVAVFIEHFDDSGTPQHIWFLLPKDVYTDKRMVRRFYNTNATWYVNITKELKPPLDAANGAWWVLNRKKFSSKMVDGFFG